MNPITHNCQQGSAEWLQLRTKFFTASEASAMMGASKYQTRTALLRAKSTGIVEDVDAGKQRLFDAGHAAEASARPIVEAKLGEELYNVTMSVEIDGLPLLASLDGITMMGDVIWENKLLNASLKDAVNNSDLPLNYAYQIEQQMLVSGATKAYFTTSDGTEAGTFGMWYESDPELVLKLIAGWKQFAIDLANYQHTEAKPGLVAEVVKDLPAVMVQVSGSVSIVDNFVLFEAALRDFVENKLVRSPQTDQDFVDLDEQIKSLKKAEDALDAAEVQMISQVASVDAMKRTKDMLHKLARDNRLIAEKLLKAEKENRKAEIVMSAQSEMRLHSSALADRVGINFPLATPIFAESIKGLKSLDSMRDKVSAALANAKIESSATADRIEANIKSLECEGQSWRFLFPDLQAVCTKASDDFAALLAARKASHAAAESARIEKIRAEEKAKAEAAAAAKVAEEARIAKAEADAKAATEKAEADRLAAEEIRKIDEQRKSQAMERAKQLAEEASAAMPVEAQKQTVEDHTEQPLALVDQLPDATKMIDDRSGPRITSLRIQISDELGKMNVFELGNVLAYCQALPLKNKLAA